MGRLSSQPSRGAVRKHHLPPSWCYTDLGMSKDISPEGDVYFCWWWGRDLSSVWHPLWAARERAIPSHRLLTQLSLLRLSAGWMSMLSSWQVPFGLAEMSPIPPKPAQVPFWGLRAVIFILRWKLRLSSELQGAGALENNWLFEEWGERTFLWLRFFKLILTTIPTPWKLPLWKNKQGPYSATELAHKLFSDETWNA